MRPDLAAPISTDSQWLLHVGRVEVEAHRQVALLAGELQRVGALAEAGDADRRMRALQRLDVRLQEAEHRVGLGDVPVLALVVEGLVRRPELQDDVERFARHLAVGARHAVDVEHRPVAGQARGGDAEVQAPARDVVEHGDPVRELGRVVIGQQEAAGTEADVLGLHQRLRDQQVGRGVRLPRCGVMLADPGFSEAQLVEPADHLEIPFVAVLQGPLGRMRRHGEITELHRFLLLSLWTSRLPSRAVRKGRGCMSDDVLILIDQQKAMDHPKWGPRNNPGAEANIARLLADWRRRGAPVVHVKHDSTNPDSPFRPGQEGNDFLPLTAPRDGELVVAKNVHSAFIGTDLAAGLQAMAGAGGDKPPLVICGVLLANSVEATVRGRQSRLPGCACRAMPAGRATSAT